MYLCYNKGKRGNKMRVNVKFWVFLFVLVIFGSLSVNAQQNTTGLSAILDHYAARNFTAGSIPEADLNSIIQAGIRAPSAMNRQPWHITVVQNIDLARKIISGVESGNVLIVVSTQVDVNGSHVFDCGLAVQSIYLAAQTLGYGSRIYTGPISDLNRKYKTELSLPNKYNAVALVRVGKIKEPAPDAVSAASPRKKTSDLVTFK